MIVRAERVQRLAALSYPTGTDYEGSKHTPLDCLPFNAAGQTTRGVCSFTFALAHLLTTSGGPFVRSMTEEAAWYIGDHVVSEYEDHVRRACQLAGVEYPEPEQVTS